MSIEEKFVSNLKLVRSLIDEELERIETGKSKHSIELIKMIENEVACMETARNMKTYMPGYPHIIIDQWSYDSELGNALLELSQLYKRIYK